MTPDDTLRSIRYVRRAAADIATLALTAAEAGDPASALPHLIDARERLDAALGAAYRFDGALREAALMAKNLPTPTPSSS